MPDGGADPLLDDGKFIGCPKLFSVKHTKKGQTSPLPANFTILMGAEFGRAQLGTSTIATMTIMYSLEFDFEKGQNVTCITEKKKQQKT